MTSRAEAKDYLDIDSLVPAGIDLSTMLAAGGVIHGRGFNPLIPLKALCYFEDGNLATLPTDVRRRLVEAVAAVDLDQLPTVTPIPLQPGTTP